MSGLLGLTVVFAALFMAACGGQSSTPALNRAATLGLTIRDNPPAGVTVLSFEISVTGASLQPADASQPKVSLLASPVEIELEKLQTNSAFLSIQGVAPGTYSTLTITFANPELTILNQSGQPILVGTQACANGQICELKPQLNSSSVALRQRAFPAHPECGCGRGVGARLRSEFLGSKQSLDYPDADGCAGYAER